MNKKSKLKVLIVGGGSIGSKEVKVLRNHPLIKVVGLVEINKEKRESLSKYVPKTYSNLIFALKDSNPDLVRIATPPKTHKELALLSLNSGKDVYIEKIMTLNSDDAREIVKLAKKLKKNVYVRRNAIYSAVYHEAYGRLKEIGEIRHIHWIEPRETYSAWSQYKQKWLRKLPGRIISEHIPHALYTVRWFLGGEPEVENVVYTEKELQVFLRCGKKTAQISYQEPSDNPMLMYIFGSKGVLEINHSSYRIFKPIGFEDSSTLEMRTLKANIYDICGAIYNLFRLVGHFFVRELHLNEQSVYSKSDNYRQFTDIARGKVFMNFKIDGEEGLNNVILFEKIWKKVGEIK
ncbi:MAG: Gfo/Idh/MocA family oxidoreductase [archaeon]